MGAQYQVARIWEKNSRRGSRNSELNFLKKPREVGKTKNSLWEESIDGKNFFIQHEEIWTSLLQGRSSLVKKRWKVERTHAFAVSSTLLLYGDLSLHLFSLPFTQKSFNISYTAGMLVIKSLSLPFSKNSFSWPSFLKDIFTGYRIQGGQFFISFRTLAMSFHCLLIYLVFEAGSHSYFCFSDCNVSFGLWLLLRLFPPSLIIINWFWCA